MAGAGSWEFERNFELTDVKQMKKSNPAKIHAARRRHRLLINPRPGLGNIYLRI